MLHKETESLHVTLLFYTEAVSFAENTDKDLKHVFDGLQVSRLKLAYMFGVVKQFFFLKLVGKVNLKLQSSIKLYSKLLIKTRLYYKNKMFEKEY